MNTMHTIMPTFSQRKAWQAINIYFKMTNRLSRYCG